MATDSAEAEVRRSAMHFGGRPLSPGQLGVTDSQLAVLLRQAQWALDEAAHDFPAGRVSAQRREELAVTLEGLAVIVRASAPMQVIEGSQDGAR